jgi:hypothetical protein
MFKKLLLSISLFAVSLSSQATLVIDESNITGADMSGISVTALFADNTSEIGVWATLTTDILNTGNDVLDAEGFSGGVVANTWSLVQQGYSIGNIAPDDSILGLWTLSNLSSASNIVGFEIDGLIANIAFDILGDTDITPNSGAGVGFVSPDHNITYVYSDQVNLQYNDLFGSLSVTLATPLASGEELVFIADTEKLIVPEPTSLAMVLTGLLFGASRIRSSKK